MLGALDAATDEFGQRLALVGAEAWALPTPCADWVLRYLAAASAFAEAGALERRIDHPLGVISGREFLEFGVFDITLHAWDLARSIRASERLAPELVDAVLDIVDNGRPGNGIRNRGGRARACGRVASRQASRSHRSRPHVEAALPVRYRWRRSSQRRSVCAFSASLNGTSGTRFQAGRPRVLGRPRLR
jgi:hypothetical protein